MKNKITALLLVAAQLALFSCGDQQNSNTESSIEDTQSGDTTASDGYSPSKTFDDKEVNILLWTGSRIAITEETGDVIDDAVYKRNLKVEDELKVKFKYDSRTGHGNEYSSWLSTLNSSILAGDNAYQLAGGYGYRLSTEALSGNFMDLADNPYIDFTKPWWPSNIIEAADIGGKITMAFGNIDPVYYDSTYAVFFNKVIAEDNKLNDIYQLVNDGKWTLDKFLEYSQAAADDLNGDSKMTEEDRYGVLFDTAMSIDAFINSCDIKITSRDSDGLPKLIGLSEKYINVQQKLRSAIHNSDHVSYGNENNSTLFMSGKALFMPVSLKSAHTLRAMDDDFGIIPYPKYNEEQEKYITHNSIGNTTAYLVPITSDAELAGCVLEALAYYGYKDILPEYYERALKGKGTRDDESAAMLDLIFANIEFEFTQIYSFNFGDNKSPSMALRASVYYDEELASTWAKSENLYEETMKNLINELK